MGRTKAGKSTLHSVILAGDNSEFIGVGKERTTRYNRIYQWNGIRIIDTPGIGAPDGKKDKEIAASIIDESDLICFVVLQDVQETEFAFLKEIKDQNKPVIILLNYKDNFLRTAGQKQGFLDAPLEWYYRQGKDDIRGTINRISTYVQKYYNNANFEICPVQLLAARLSQTSENKTECESYLKGSRIQTFLNDIRVNILQFGTIKRSQTILDGSIYHLNSYDAVISEEICKLEELKKTLHSDCTSALSDINKAGVNAINSIRRGIASIYDTFINIDIPSFAVQYYEADENQIGKLFEKYVQSCGFKDNLTKRVQSELSNYESTIVSRLKTMSERIHFNTSEINLGRIETSNIFDTKSLFNIGGSIVSLAGAILLLVGGPGGAIVAGIGLAITLIGGLFKSKKKKIKEAQDKLCSNLQAKFSESRDKSIEEISSQISAQFLTIESEISDTISDLENGLSDISSVLKNIHGRNRNNRDILEKAYAARIINFASGQKLCDPLYEENVKNIEVDRIFGKELKISSQYDCQVNFQQLSKVLQETIIYIKNDK